MKRGNETVNRIIDGLKYWAFPKTNAEAAREIDMEVRKIIESSHEETKKLLQDHEQILIGLATKLLEQETMDGEEMQKFIEEHNK